MFVHRIRKYLGAYMVHLKGKVDAIVMSAGVGENSPAVRSLLLEGLEVQMLVSLQFCKLCLSETACYECIVRLGMFVVSTGYPRTG